MNFGAGRMGYAPRLYFEAKIHVTDVRSGVRDACTVNLAVEIHAMEDDAMWTRDMVLTVEASKVEPGLPESTDLASLPAFVNGDYLYRMETLFLAYLMRYYEIRVFGNYALNVYSATAESLEDFEKRCVEMLVEGFRKDLDASHEIFQRKLEQIREKYLRESVGMAPGRSFEAVKVSSHWKSRLHETSRRLTDLFLGTQLTAEAGVELPALSPPTSMDLEQRLYSLELEARQEIRRFLSQYQERVRTIDEYTVHPNLKDIHMVRTCILWMPCEVRS